MDPTVVISLDCELSWGAFDTRYGPELLQCARWTHDVGIPNLLRHLTRNGLSATWAVVGAAMLDRLPPVHEMDEVHYPHFSRPWFDYVPEGRETDHPEWFGASVVRLISEASPAQEVGSHSFSHVIFDLPGTSRLRASQEFQRCAEIAKDLGLRADSFVFPRNSIKYLDELQHAGFICYRSADKFPLEIRNRRLRSIVGLLADIWPVTPATVYPQVRNNLVDIPGSLMIRYAKGY